MSRSAPGACVCHLSKVTNRWSACRCASCSLVRLTIGACSVSVKPGYCRYGCSPKSRYNTEPLNPFSAFAYRKIWSAEMRSDILQTVVGLRQHFFRALNPHVVQKIERQLPCRLFKQSCKPPTIHLDDTRQLFYGQHLLAIMKHVLDRALHGSALVGHACGIGRQPLVLEQ